MYTVMMAARIRNSSLLSAALKASAEPWKAVMTLAGTPMSCSAPSMALTAPPSDSPEARLKEMVAAGNWFRWLMTSGVCWVSMSEMAESGTWELLATEDGRYTEFSEARLCCSEGSASRITRYWFDWVKMVETMRWP